ncbi:hypothetical protein GCM10011352_01200 [Marinobacterium zhoushanense]|uniref:DUF1795 domain-containing protein n=1 Tax=Marinobacterium zhoushanense TaxID=1679163 RepID=A0ABQ1JZC9_9GAMM|nr:hypothetical protein [Marinobacterium zhoushanense]GGB79302.1 hypothetical protein GCM10011352_01200 [Marinobacterium zhoushanense]
MCRILTLVILLIVSFNSYAFRFSGGELTPPQGFEGPVTKDMGRGSQTIAFFKEQSEKFKTLLQITVFETGQELPEMSESELKQGLSNYLLKFLSGVSRQRANFIKSDVTFVDISGITASKVSWRGSAHGMELEGVMYCYLSGSKIISMHTQDLASNNSIYIKQAVNSIESIKR